MAQQIQTQPGDEKSSSNEGDVFLDEESFSKYGNYRCVFRQASDSLYVLMKNTKTKRSFTNTFSKAALAEMDWKGDIEKMVNLLEEARGGKNDDVVFKVAFGDAENDKPVSFSTLSKAYMKGCAMYVFVAMEYSYFSAQYLLKLPEQERSETDILRDIITDMQEEIDELKKTAVAPNRTGIASWYTNLNGGGDIPMDGVHVESTLDGMVALSDDKKTITVGLAGVYRIVAQVNFTSHTGAGHEMEIKVNDTRVSRKIGSDSGGYGPQMVIVNLETNDTIKFTTGHLYETNKEHSAFIVEKL